MNILFLLRLWPVYGGGETVTICLANEMVKRGWHVSVAYFKKATKGNLSFIDSAIKSFQIKGVNCDEFIAAESDSDKVQNTIIEYVKSEKIDVIINQWWPYFYITRLKTETSAKVITCLHQAFYTPILDGCGFKHVLKMIFRPCYESLKKKKAVHNVRVFLPYVDKYVFLSPSFQKQFEKLADYDNKDKKITSIPNPLVYSVELTNDDISKKENMVLLVGRMLEGQKRITKAIKIWSEIEKDNSLDNWKFVVVGEGPDLPAYKQLARQFGLKRISFEGYQNPLSYYKRAKIFMMTSAFEGFPMTLVEAQQCGVVPIVMDSFLSLHDIVENENNGCIVKNEDLGGFVKSLKKLMTNENHLYSLRSVGLISNKKYSVDKIVDTWNALFTEINN